MRLQDIVDPNLPPFGAIGITAMQGRDGARPWCGHRVSSVGRTRRLSRESEAFWTDRSTGALRAFRPRPTSNRPNVRGGLTDT